MAIRTSCRCGRELRVKDELAGKQVRCPACQAALAVPRAAPPGGGRDEVHDDPPRGPRRPAAPPAEREGRRRRPRRGGGSGQGPSRAVLWGVLGGGGVALAVVAMVAVLLWPRAPKQQASGPPQGLFSPDAGGGPEGERPDTPDRPAPEPEVIGPKATIRTPISTGNFLNIAISRDGRRVAARGFSKGAELVKVYEVPGGRELLSLDAPRPTGDLPVALSPDGTLVAFPVGILGRLTLHELPGGKQPPDLPPSEKTGAVADGLLFTPNGDLLVMALANRVIGWDLRERSVRFSWPAGDVSVRTLGVFPDGRRLATGMDDRSVRVWDVASGEVVQTLRDPGEDDSSLLAVAVSPDGKVLAAAQDGRGLTLWDLDTGKVKQRLEEASVRRGLCFVSGGRLAFFTRSGDIVVANVATGARERVLRGHPACNRPQLAVSDDGVTLVSGSDDGTIRVWELPK